MKNKQLFILASLLVLTGCQNASENSLPTLDTKNIEVRELYDNKFDEEKIPGQWSQYGCGDPFVYRFNGKYYLYVSTKNYQPGVRGWVSEDLIHWSQVNNGVNDEGYVTVSETTVTAYAPEIMYFNGYFYMCESQGGSGHYILRSESPEGPFEPITDNFGESIDGSFFIDDNEQIYFLRASNTGVRMCMLDETKNFAIVNGQKKLDDTQLGGWTEGPYLLKREGTYYLTYTGNNVLSNGYRVGYSYSTETADTIFTRDAFKQGDIIVLNTDDDFHGLGHSSTVMGPDMDSYYIAYHNLNSTGGPNRSFNISRLFFSGTDMYARNVELHNNITPNRPIFYTYDDEFETVGNFNLSNKASEDIFTAEFNFIGADTKCIFSYVDDNNYNYVTVNSNNTISVKQVSNGKENEIASSTLLKSYDYSKIHTLRVTYKDANLDVYFDNMCKIDNQNVTLKGGKIGYLDASLSNVEYTAFSNSAQGSSDNEEVKQGKTLAANYSLKYSGLSDASKLVLKEANENDEYNENNGSYDLLLASEGDRATYPFYFTEDAFYGINLTLDKKYCGKKIRIQIDNGDIYRVAIPSVSSCSGQYVNVILTELDITAGSHYISFYCDGDAVAFHQFEFFKSSKSQPTFEHSLDNFVSTGATYVNSWKLKYGGHHALESNRQILYFGDETLTNYTVECDVALIGETATNTAGFLIRGNNPAFSSYDSITSVQGYYVGFNASKVTITKCNYDRSNQDISADARKFTLEQFYHFKITVNGNKITVNIDDETEISFADSLAFNYGYFGLYTDGAAATYKNLKIY